MLIDWFTVCAQTFNFLTLVWLLKRFLYKPVVSAIDARDKKIAEQLEDAASQKAEAQKQIEEFQGKNAQLEQQRESILSQANEAARGDRQKLLEAAHRDAETLRSRLQDGVNRERERLTRELASATQREVLAIARKALSDLAGTDLDERMTAVFIRRFQALDEEQKEGLKAAGGQCGLLRSATALPEAQRAALKAAFKDTPLQFETRPELVCGLELTVNGHKLSWSISEYLAALSKSVDGLLSVKPTPLAEKPSPQPEVAPPQPVAPQKETANAGG